MSAYRAKHLDSQRKSFGFIFQNPFWIQSCKDWIHRCKGWIQNLQKWIQNRETLRYMVFDRRQTIWNGTGNSPTASVLNPRLTSIPCVSTENKKIAVTVTLYQNNRDSVARFCNMDTNATSYSKLCNIFANFAFLITLDLHEYNLTLHNAMFRVNKTAMSQLTSFTCIQKK